MRPDGGPVPLARLLAMAYRQLIDGLHERLAGRGWTDVRPAYGYVLLAVRDAATSPTELAHRFGVSKQAASKLVGQMVAAGYLRSSAHDRDGRMRTVELAPRGVDLLGEVERIYAELEAEWAAVLGGAGVERVRDDLTAVLLATNEGALPAIRPTG